MGFSIKDTKFWLNLKWRQQEYKMKKKSLTVTEIDEGRKISYPKGAKFTGQAQVRQSSLSHWIPGSKHLTSKTVLTMDFFFLVGLVWFRFFILRCYF